MSWGLSITKLYALNKSRVTFDEMPQLVASLITEVRSLRICDPMQQEQPYAYK